VEVVGKRGGKKKQQPFAKTPTSTRTCRSSAVADLGATTVSSMRRSSLVRPACIQVVEGGDGAQTRSVRSDSADSNPNKEEGGLLLDLVTRAKERSPLARSRAHVHACVCNKIVQRDLEARCVVGCCGSAREWKRNVCGVFPVFLHTWRTTAFPHEAFHSIPHRMVPPTTHQTPMQVARGSRRRVCATYGWWT
jgi:hypothetical protein